jgi:hypothetical protein
MMARSWTSRSQESATGERAAMFGGSMMAKSWTSRSKDSATGARAVIFGGRILAKSCKNVKGAAERWLRYSEEL